MTAIPPRPAGPVPDPRLPGAVGRSDAAHAARSSGRFSIDGAVDAARVDVGGVPGPARRRPSVDIHCVTKWSKLDTSWRGVSLDTLLEDVDTAAEYLTAWCDGGYTTNLPLDDLSDGKAWVVYEYEGEPLEPEHGGPARLLVPHLYFWKSAKWVRGLALTSTTSRASGRATATTIAAIHGSSSATRATDLADRARGRARRGDHAREEPVLDCPSGRPPPRPARRRAPDRRGRLPGAAQLLDRLRARGRRSC